MVAGRRAQLRGIVQGVGLRPFVVGLARRFGLTGSVVNRGGVVIVEVAGAQDRLDGFAAGLVDEAPAGARIESVTWAEVELPEREGFEIGASEAVVDGALAIGPDLRVCDACLAEVGDPGDRRFGYGLNGCTQCGPRLTVATGSPWARERSSLARFSLCGACAQELGDADDRRFHAEAIACPVCGPRLRLEDREGRTLAGPGEAIAGAVAVLERGGIVAVQGIGGFQLLVDARDETAVLRLRERKHRPSKPLAVMVADLGSARELAKLDPETAELLTSSAGPIVLVRRRPEAKLAEAITPRRPALGVMLATTPAHALLLAGLGGPLVATSGNVHGRPIARISAEARAELGEVADAWLVHEREIQRRCDDSVVQVVDGRTRVLRLGRGLAPTSVAMPEAFAELPAMIGLGAQLEAAPMLLVGGRAIAWPHVGDLDEPATRAAMIEAVADVQAMLGVEAPTLVIDAHPDAAIRSWALAEGRRTGAEVRAVFHHQAHVAAVLAEHGRTSALGFAWDGTGYGFDHGHWGGEVLAVEPHGATRVGHLQPFPLPGGDAAARDGLRPLAGLAHAAGLALPELGPELDRLRPLLATPRLAPPTTSVGRLFDAVAALTGICRRSGYEAEAAQRLELAAELNPLEVTPYPFAVIAGVLDWRPMVLAMIRERERPSLVASRFHATLIAMIVTIAEAHARVEPSWDRTVALAGGCFANRLLLAGASERLRAAGFDPIAPERVPPGDGGLALGQLWVVGQSLTRGLS